MIHRLGPRSSRSLLALIASAALLAGSLPGCGGQPEPKPRWVTTVGHSVLSDPTTVEDLILAEGEDSLSALDASSGVVRWQRHPLGRWSLGHAAVAGGVVYIQGDGLYALDAASGVTRWTWPFPAGVKGMGDPAVAAGLVYIAADGTNRIYVLDARTGSLRSTLQVAVRNGFYGSALIIEAQTIIVDVWPDGRLFAFDAFTGAVRWSAAMPGDHQSDAVLAGDAVYVTTTTGTVHSVDALTGAVRWSAHASGQGPGVIGPTVAAGMVYVGHDDNRLYALSASSGSLVWTAVTGGNVEGPSTVAGGVVYVGAEDGRLYAFDASTGKPRGAAHPGIVGTTPLVIGGSVYVGTLDGRIYAYDTAAFR